MTNQKTSNTYSYNKILCLYCQFYWQIYHTFVSDFSLHTLKTLSPANLSNGWCDGGHEQVLSRPFLQYGKTYSFESDVHWEVKTFFYGVTCHKQCHMLKSPSAVSN